MRVLVRSRVVPPRSSACPASAFLIFAIAFAIFANPFAVWAGWLTPQPVTSGEASLPPNNEHYLAVGDSGSIHLVWSEDRDGDYDIYYRCFGGLGWSPDISVTSNSSTSKSPCIALDDGGTLHLVWMDNESGTTQIYHKSYDGTSWSSQTQVTNSTGSPQSLSMAVDHAGRVHVVWTDYASGGWWLYYRCRDGADWGPIETLTPTGAWPYMPCVATDASNNLHMVWRDDRSSADPELYYRKHSGDAWEPEQKLTDSPGVPCRPSIAVSTGGDVHIFWEDNRAGKWEIYYKLMSGGEWGPEEFFAGADGNVFGPSCCADREGSAYVVWYKPDPNPAVYSRKFDGVSWLSPDTLAYSGRSDTSPCVAVGGGRTDVVWKYGGIWWSCSVGAIPEPSLLSLDTPAWPACETAPVLITGQNLSYVERAWLAKAGEESIRVMGAGLSTTLLSSTFDIGPATPGPWDVVIQSFSGDRDTLPGAFRVEQGFWGADERLTLSADSSQLARPTARAIAVDSQGDLHIVWSDSRDGGTEIYYKRRHAGGWGPDTRLTVASGASTDPAIAIDGLDRLHVVWSDERDGNAEIYYKSYEGALWGTDQRLTSTMSSRSDCPAIAADRSTNHVVVIWHESENSSIYIRRFSGSTWYSAVRLYYGALNGSATPTIAADNSGHFDAAWVEYHGNTNLIAHRRHNGSAWEGRDTLAAAAYLGGPSICAGPGAALHLTWHDQRPGNALGGFEIFYMGYDGTAWGPEQRLSEAPSYSENSSVAVAPDGVVHVVWSDNRWGNFEVYHACFDGIRWTIGGRLTRATSRSDRPSAACDAEGNLHIIWQDSRDGYPQIYHSMATAGTLAGVGDDPKSRDGLGGPAEAIAACPNPTSFVATLRFRTRQEGPVKVSLYDVSGRCVRSYDEGTRIPGRYEIVWDGRDHNGQKVSAGVYFCRLEIGPRLSTARLVILR
jgi:hypothetical protein